MKSAAEIQVKVRSRGWGIGLGFRAVRMSSRRHSPVNTGGLRAVEAALQTDGYPAWVERPKRVLLSCHMGEGQGHLGSYHGTTEGPEASSKGQSGVTEDRSHEEVAEWTCR